MFLENTIERRIANTDLSVGKSTISGSLVVRFAEFAERHFTFGHTAL